MSDSQQSRPSAMHVFLVAFVTAIGGFLFGFDLGMIGAANIYLKDQFAVGGLGVGLCSIASPMYIAEVAPPKKRGRLGLMYQLAIVVGHIVAPVIGYLVAITLPQSEGVAQIAWQQPWRWMFFSETVCVALFVMFVFSLPRSPRC